jgi:hypothetical protein
MTPVISEIKNLSQLAGQTINIVQPSIWKNHFELKVNDQTLGIVNSRGLFRSLLMIKIFDKEWEIFRRSFWSSEISIKEKGKENPFASYNRKFFSFEGFVHLPKGKRVKIRLEAFRRKSGIYNMMGKCIVSLKDKISFKSVTTITEISIEESSEILDEYPWIIILAWHLTQMRRRSQRAG